MNEITTQFNEMEFGEGKMRKDEERGLFEGFFNVKIPGILDEPIASDLEWYKEIYQLNGG